MPAISPKKLKEKRAKPKKKGLKIPNPGRKYLRGVGQAAAGFGKSLIPGVGAGAMVEGGAKVLAEKQAKKKANKAWKAGTVDLKGGGKVHRAGLARRRRS